MHRRGNLLMMSGLLRSPSRPLSSSCVVESDARLSSRRLPLPALRQTLDKYLKSLEPFLQEDEDCGGPSRNIELSKRVNLALEFEGGLGAILQNRLLALDKASPFNWLDDNFWMKTAYLQSRTSLMVHSNWWCVYHPDASVPTILPPERGQYTFWQIRRAAWLVHKMLEYRARLEKTAAHRIDLSDVPFQMPFYRCRIPGDDCDSLASLPARGATGSRKIILMLHNWFYSIEVLDNADGAIPAGEIETRMWSAVHDATSRRTQGYKPVPVGLLTTCDRKTWYKARNHLLEISPRNRMTFSAIEESIFVLSLDDYTLSSGEQPTFTRDIVLDAHVRNASTGIAGHNRWYDKCVSIFIENNARAGGMGEHSPCDGLVVGAMMDHSLSENIDNRHFGRNGVPTLSDIGATTGWERLDWEADGEIMDQIVNAEIQARTIMDDSDASMLCFHNYGARWIKDTVKLSPDAYAQMALQLAWYKTQGNFTATYETATTQMFTHGRTETIRSYSTESRQFVKSMVDPQCSAAMRVFRLKEAVRAHNVATRQAIRGQGIDRHMLGLRLVMHDGEKSQLFNDPLFERSQTWKLSTSGLFRGDKFSGTGFGSPLRDGYGIQYILDPEALKFGVESKRSCPTTSTERFKIALTESLNIMRDLCEEELRVGLDARL